MIDVPPAAAPPSAVPSGTPVPMIEALSLSRRYEARDVVDRLTLTVRRGEWYIFLGHNGAGKSTTIKMLLGLVQPTGGSGRVAGLDIVRSREAIHRVTGYMPENLQPYEYLTGYEYLEFVGDAHQLEPGYARARILALSELLDLTGALRTLVRTWSLGMRKKLGFAAALLHEPQVLFLDEPAADLDPKAAGLIRSLIRALCDRGMTVFMTTHILTHAEQLCDQVGILYQGRLLVQDSPQALSAAHGGAALEDIFLRLTGRVETERVERFLRQADPRSAGG